MKRLALFTLVSCAALAGAALIGVAWNERAREICREQLPGSASRDSVTWQWEEFAYVCDYRPPGERPKRVGIVDAFHGEDSRRHGLDPLSR